MKVKYCISLIILLLAVLITSIPSNAEKSIQTQVSRGKYLIKIGGCNDCHTPGYAVNGGAIAEDKWLIGDSLGFRGPWGTTYASNLRKYFSNLTEDEWVTKAKFLRTRPNMPWWIVNAMTEDDSRAVYKYVTSLQLVVNYVPTYVPPSDMPKMPYVQWPTQ